MSSLLRNSIILDTETLGLERGAGMHELAFFDLQRRHVESFLLNPNAVTVQTAVPQEHTRLAGSVADQYTAHKYGNWMERLHELVGLQAGDPVLPGQTRALLEEQQPWLAAQLQDYPHLLNPENAEDLQSIAARKARFEEFGITANLRNRPVAVTDAVGALEQAMSGKTVWIANAAFESKQIGAQLGAMGPEAWEKFKSGFETWNPRSPDPFYVTGTEVTKARVLAQQTGDWTRVWRAYQQHVPAVGETAVRDIQDVTRALHSYGKQLGFTTKDLSYMGTGVDISHRIHALAAGDQARTVLTELHRAGEDAAIHEAYVLERNIKLVEALQQVAEGTELGTKYLQQGAEGPLGTAARYFQALEAHGPLLMQEQALKRLQRAQQDFFAQGWTSQRVGGSPYVQPQLSPQGDFRSAWRLQGRQQRMTSMDQVLDFLELEGRYSQYGVDVREMWGTISAAQDTTELNAQVHQQVQDLHSKWQATSVGAPAARLDRVLRAPKNALGAEIIELAARAGPRAAGAALLATGAVGGFFGLFQEPPAPEPSLLHGSYDQWAERNRIEGMSEGPVASTQRREITDFGSPYRGPTGSQQVFVDQERLQARERWLRSQYGAQHIQTGLPSLPAYSSFMPGGYQFVAGTPVVAQDYAMRGDLQRINVRDGWKITADDADTVTIKRGGLRGALSSFFGQNRGYSFRLAGLDAPETPHGDRAAQPWALESKAAFVQMLADSKNIEIIFDPKETTYGRALGAVFADGRNLNIELVKRGLASHLPYGKARNAIIDYKTLEEAESRAYLASRGMWSQPWAKSFYEHSAASGNRVTFNTLAKTQSVVKNKGTMQMITAMEQAQAQGTFSPQAAALARELGSKYNVGDDRVGPWSMSVASTPSTSYLQEQLQDLAGFIRTRGRGENQNKFRSRGSYGKLDQTLVLDTLGASNTVWTRRQQAAFSQYSSGKALNRARKSRMAFQQRRTLQALNSSPVGHTRM